MLYYFELLLVLLVVFAASALLARLFSSRSGVSHRQIWQSLPLPHSASSAAFPSIPSLPETPELIHNGQTTEHAMRPLRVDVRKALRNGEA